MKRVILIACALFPGCRCEQADPPPAPPTAIGAMSMEPLAPTGKVIRGFFCEGGGEPIAPPKDAFRSGSAFVARGAGWEDVPDPASQVITVAGVRDRARRPEDGALFWRRRIPGSEIHALLTAKPHEFPAGTTFDAKGAQAAFDEVAADPRAALLGARAVTWAGRPAVEGAVAEPMSNGRMLVHHLIVPTEGTKALVVTFIAPEDPYHQLLSEACAAVGVAK